MRPGYVAAPLQEQNAAFGIQQEMPAEGAARQARSQGYAARSVFKLEEIQQRARVLAPGDRVVDLGCFPGSWSRYAREVVGERGALVGVDFDAPQGVPGTFLEASVMDVSPQAIREALGGPADVVLSDMAASASGHKATDHLRIIALAETAAWFAFDVLTEGGAFAAKVLQGGTEGELLTLLKKHFTKVSHIKPPASRADSAEMYVVATGFRGRADQTESRD